LLNKLFATREQTAPLLLDAPSDAVWDEAQIRTWAASLSMPDHAQFAAWVELFASWGTRLKDAHDRSVNAGRVLEVEREALRSLQSEESARLAADRVAFDAEQVLQRSDRAALETSRLALTGEREAVEEQRLAVVRQQEALTRQAAELRGQLVLEREESLQTLRQQVEELERRRDRLPAEISQHRAALLERAREDAESLKAGVQAQGSLLHERELQLNAHELALATRDRKLAMNEELLRVRRGSLTEEIREDFQRQLDDAQKQSQRLQARLDQAHQQKDQLQQELDDLGDLRAQVGDDPQRLLDDLDDLRQRNRDLDRQVQELLAGRSEEDASQLRLQRDDLQQRLTQAEHELSDLHRRQSEWHRSVTEREDWQKTRKVLETNRALLQGAVSQLQQDVDDLLHRQQQKTVFPELTRMDAELTVKKSHTESVPEKLSQLVDELQCRIAYAEKGKQLYFRKEELQLFLGGLAMSQLHVFQGISGTGKTSLATAFAKAVGGVCTTVPVQAGWRDRADLIGHYNAFEKRYYERNTLQALYRAQTEAESDQLHIVLLDEMNLSRPEQYFAEFLSAMEMGESNRWINLMESRPVQGAPRHLRDGRDIRLPPNLWFIGTANHDETTNAFADKTHDRAFVLELPRQEVPEGNLRRLKPVAWSYQSLADRFDAVCNEFQPQVADLMAFINGSELTRMLGETFNLGWGNRLERQMMRFVPVVLEAGGSEALAVDHLLSSRMFRDGKVIGRHGVERDDLQQVEVALLEMWRECELEGEPTRCLTPLRRAIKRLERGG
jgi:uncharacterized coiled-coil DUF342 family protein